MVQCGPSLADCLHTTATLLSHTAHLSRQHITAEPLRPVQAAAAAAAAAAAQTGSTANCCANCRGAISATSSGVIPTIFQAGTCLTLCHLLGLCPPAALLTQCLRQLRQILCLRHQRQIAVQTLTPALACSSRWAPPQHPQQRSSPAHRWLCSRWRPSQRSLRPLPPHLVYQHLCRCRYGPLSTGSPSSGPL